MVMSDRKQGVGHPNCEYGELLVQLDGAGRPIAHPRNAAFVKVWCTSCGDVGGVNTAEFPDAVAQMNTIVKPAQVRFLIIPPNSPEGRSLRASWAGAASGVARRERKYERGIMTALSKAIASGGAR